MIFLQQQFVLFSVFPFYLFSDEKEVSSNILDVYICNIRKKLGVDLVKTKRGSGYYIDWCLINSNRSAGKSNFGILCY